jgi:anaerobic selenocysteine-containing dehydrogenase
MAAVKQPKEDKWVKTVCYVCQNTCSIKAHVVDGVVVKLEGNPESPWKAILKALMILVLCVVKETPAS